LAGCCWLKHSFVERSLDCSQKLLTPAGLFHGWLLSVLIWGSLGWGYLVGTIFWLALPVTRIGMAEKEAERIAEKQARGPENVWGRLTGTLCALGFVVSALEVKQLITSLLCAWAMPGKF